MSVAAHLNIRLDEYDARIRTFIPGYDAMLDAGAAALRAIDGRPRPVIVDLGTGTGAFAERCVRVLPRAAIIGVDEDLEILALARKRLAGASAELRGGRVQREALPRADAIVASLARHHVTTRASKQALYRRIATALRPGGIFITADCFPPADARMAAVARDDWRAHLQKTYTPRETARFFAAWAREDRYFTLEAELAMLKASGLKPGVIWRAGTMGVIAARR